MSIAGNQKLAQKCMLSSSKTAACMI